MAKKRKPSRRRRASVRGLNSKDASGFLMQAALGALGAIVFKKVVSAVLPAEQAQYANYALVAGGVGAALLVKNPTIAAAGLGAATVALSNIGEDLVDGQAATNGLGLLRPGVPSVRIGEPFNNPAGMKVNYV